MNLSITPGTNNVGAYINDIDLKNLNKEQAKEIKNILNQYGVIFIKEQNLDPGSFSKFRKRYRSASYLSKIERSRYQISFYKCHREKT